MFRTQSGNHHVIILKIYFKGKHSIAIESAGNPVSLTLSIFLLFYNKKRVLKYIWFWYWFTFFGSSIRIPLEEITRLPLTMLKISCTHSSFLCFVITVENWNLIHKVRFFTNINFCLVKTAIISVS